MAPDPGSGTLCVTARCCGHGWDVPGCAYTENTELSGCGQDRTHADITMWRSIVGSNWRCQRLHTRNTMQAHEHIRADAHNILIAMER